MGSRWYFDAVSASDNSSVVVVFYNGGPLGFINSIVYYEDGPLSVSISGSFANGTAYSLPVSSTGGAVVDVEGGTITGNWTGSGFSFVGTREEGEEVMSYVISIDSPEIGVYGTITFESVSAGYPMKHVQRICFGPRCKGLTWRYSLLLRIIHANSATRLVLKSRSSLMSSGPTQYRMLQSLLISSSATPP